MEGWLGTCKRGEKWRTWGTILDRVIITPFSPPPDRLFLPHIYTQPSFTDFCCQSFPPSSPPYLAVHRFFLFFFLPSPLPPSSCSLVCQAINSSETLFRPLSRLYWLGRSHTCIHTHGNAAHSCLLQHTPQPVAAAAASPPPCTHPLSSHAVRLSCKHMKPLCVCVCVHTEWEREKVEWNNRAIDQRHECQAVQKDPPHLHCHSLGCQSNSKSQHISEVSLSILL